MQKKRRFENGIGTKRDGGTAPDRANAYDFYS